MLSLKLAGTTSWLRDTTNVSGDFCQVVGAFLRNTTWDVSRPYGFHGLTPERLLLIYAWCLWHHRSGSVSYFWCSWLGHMTGKDRAALCLHQNTGKVYPTSTSLLVIRRPRVIQVDAASPIRSLVPHSLLLGNVWCLSSVFKADAEGILPHSTKAIIDTEILHKFDFVCCMLQHRTVTAICIATIWDWMLPIIWAFVALYDKQLQWQANRRGG